MEIPPEAAIKSILKAGVAFYFTATSFKSSEPHFFVVLNYDPLSDKLLLMVNASSNVERRKAARSNLPQATLVCVSPSECAFLKKESVFDCNSPILETTDNLIKKLKAGQLNIVPHIVQSDILSRLRQGVLASPLLDYEYKSIIAQDD